MSKNMRSIFLHPQGTGCNPIAVKQGEAGEEGFEYCNQTTLWEQGNTRFLQNSVSNQMH